MSLASMWALAWASVLVWTPSLSTACSVCSAGRDEENQLAVLLSTIFMSLLPLITIGTVLYVIWRRYQRFEAQSQPTAPAAATTPEASA
jgi:membrane protein DedA with SNARE-associated domain